jgi:hypothetical protein
VLSLQYEPVVQGYQNYLSNTNLDQFDAFLRHHLKPGADSHIMARIKEVYDSWSMDPGNTFYPKLSQ